MSEYVATIKWARGVGERFSDNRYSRAHQWEFDGGVTVPASASTHVLPPPLSNPAAVDPEEAFVASLSSCHMLWFLSLAARKGLVVESYTDQAVGYLEENEAGRLAMTRVTLRPAIQFSGAMLPTPAELGALHDDAHRQCFIANSVKTKVVVEGEGERRAADVRLLERGMK
jgi:organic hydroperoxide reductase OsmC/OhrA